MQVSKYVRIRYVCLKVGGLRATLQGEQCKVVREGNLPDCELLVTW